MSSDTKWWIECGANLPGGHFTRNHMMHTDKIINFRYKFGNKGIFATAYMYDSEEQANANLYGDFYLDFDHEIIDSDDKEKAFDLVRKDVLGVIRYLRIIYRIDSNDIKIYFSGSKGIHIIVPKEVMGVEPNKYLNMIYRAMASDISKLTNSVTIDLKIYDNKRLFRLPNSVHPKTDLYKVPLSYNELSSLKYSDIIKIASEPRIENKVTSKFNSKAHMEYQNYASKVITAMNRPKGNMTDVKLEFTPPCVEYLLKNPIGKGQRNDTLAFLASFFRQTGMNEEQAQETLQKWNDQMCDPSIAEKEVEITVSSIYSGNGKMGCAKAKILSQCDGDRCKLRRRGI